MNRAYSLLKVLFLPSLLLLLSGCSSNMSTDLSSDAVNNGTDLSMHYLGDLFGSVGQIHGIGGQMFEQLIGVFNQGVLIVAGLWLLYTAFSMALRASEGQFSSQQLKPHYALLRIALGMALLISPTQGYNAIETVMADVMVSSVKLANEIVDSALDYINNGGSLYAAASTENSDSSASKDYFEKLSGTPSSSPSGKIITNGLFSNAGPLTDGQGNLSFFNQILLNNACMADIMNNETSGASNSLYAHIGEYQNNPAILFPSTSDSDDSGCGYIPLESQCKTTDDSSANCQTYTDAILKVSTDLWPAAQSLVCTYSPTSTFQCTGYGGSGTSLDSLNQILPAGYVSAFLDYDNLMAPILQSNADSSSNQISLAKHFISKAKSQGWGGLGAWYWDIGRIQDIRNGNVTSSSNIDPSTLQPQAQPYNSDTNKSIANQLNTSWGSSGMMLLETLNTEISSAKSTISETIQTDQASGVNSSNQETALDAGMSLMSIIPVADVVITPVVQLFSAFDVGNSSTLNIQTNPMEWLQNLGSVLVAASVTIYMSFWALFQGLSLAGMFCNAEVDIDQPVEMAEHWAYPLILALCGAFFTSGVVFAYFLPLMPLFLYNFAVIGWLMLGVECMLAMTLIAMGLTHPEGHDFLGKSEQALMMIVSVFLKPALIVISFITSMIITYIGLEIMVTAFTTFMNDLMLTPDMQTGQNLANIGSNQASPYSTTFKYMGNFYASHASLGAIQDAVMTLVAMPICLLAFAYAVYEVTTQIFQLINTLPDQIFSWIGVQSRPSYVNPNQGSDKIKGAMDSAALRASKQASNAEGSRARDQKEKRSLEITAGKTAAAQAQLRKDKS